MIKLNTNMPEVISVIVPTLNSEFTLKRCLDSLCRQDFFNFHVYIIDGGSIDKTIKISTDYISKDPRFSLTKTHKGVSHQRNVGKKLAKGQYIFFLDSDDALNTNCLSSLLSYAKKGFDIVSPKIMFIISRNKKEYKSISNTKTITSFISYKSFCINFYKLFLNGPIKLYKKEIIKNIEFDEDVLYGEDTLFNFQIARNKNYNYAIIEEGIYFYCKPSNNNKKYAYKKNFIYIEKLMNLALSEKDHQIKENIYKIAATEYIVLKNNSLKLIFNFKIWKLGAVLFFKNIKNIKLLLKMFFPILYHFYSKFKHNTF